jgi:hypothetical protein
MATVILAEMLKYYCCERFRALRWWDFETENCLPAQRLLIAQMFLFALPAH